LQWIFTEDQLWDALNQNNLTITLASHIQLSPTGRFHSSGAPTILSEVRVESACAGFGLTCIIDMNGCKYPLFNVQPNAILLVKNVRIVNAATLGDGAAVQIVAAKKVHFEECDFVGNMATNGGAVQIRGAQDVKFIKCRCVAR
jgi:hypothetical protein